MLKEVLKILEGDARTTAKQIATMTGMPVDEIDKLIKQAEKDRVILKYKTVVNWDKRRRRAGLGAYRGQGHPGAGSRLRLHRRADLRFPAGPVALPGLRHL